MSKKKKVKQTKICVTCGIEFQSARDAQKNCSPACYRIYKNKKCKQPRVCKTCGKEFKTSENRRQNCYECLPKKKKPAGQLPYPKIRPFDDGVLPEIARDIINKKTPEEMAKMYGRDADHIREMIFGDTPEAAVVQAYIKKFTEQAC